MAVIMTPTTVIKRGGEELLAEAAKLRAYRSIRDAEFVVPRVLELDLQRGLLITERIHEYRPLVESYLNDDVETVHCFRLCGRALAQIHLVSEVTQAWVESLRDNEEPIPPGQVLLHGDFGFSNVGFRDRCQPPSLLVLDPSPDRVNVVSPLACGQPLTDLALMMSCLLGRVSISRLGRAITVHRVRLLRAFFEGYCEIGDPRCSYSEAVHAGADVLKCYLSHSKRLPRPLATAVAGALSLGCRAQQGDHVVSR